MIRAALLALLLTGCAGAPTWYEDGEHDLPSCRVSRPPCALGATGQPDAFWAARSGARLVRWAR